MTVISDTPEVYPEILAKLSDAFAVLVENVYESVALLNAPPPRNICSIDILS